MFKRFLAFLEKCKGFEEDCKRFIIMAGEGNRIQVDYDIIRPFFLRTISTKKGSEVLKLFEQLRKNLTQSKHGSKAEEQIQAVKHDFYNGLIKDLIAAKSFDLAQVIYSEKLKDKLDATTQDYIIGLEIYG